MDTFDGFCPLCEHDVVFKAWDKSYRDHLLCSCCGSIPRERALFLVIKERFPNYRELFIHETSPGARGASAKFLRECQNYTTSQYFKNVEVGSLHHTGFRCENVERMTFDDASFDLFISQDVMEHVFDPAKAFSEIHRVLKPGGAHIFTVPLLNKWKPSECWASLDSCGSIVHHKTPEYHGNPVDPEGSLVTMHWGYDIASYVCEKTGMPTLIIQIDDIGQGIRAELIEVIVSSKFS